MMKVGEAIPVRNPENRKSRPENPEIFTMKISSGRPEIRKITKKFGYY
jgi:hypothetical protein